MLTKALRKKEHDVLVASFKRQYPQWLFPGKTDKDPSLSPLRIGGVNYWLDSMNPGTWIATFFRIRRHRPEVIVVQWWTTFWAPAWWMLGVLNRLLLRAELLFYCHNVLPHETRRFDRWLARLALRQGTAFTAQSTQEKHQLLSLVPGARVTVLLLPTFDLLAEHWVPRSQAREQLDIAEDLPVLLFFGIVREYKGLADLLKALPIVKARVGPVLLIVAGEFWDDKQKYLDLIRQGGIEDSLLVDDRYIPDEEAAVYFSAADLLVAPYRSATGSAVLPTARAFRLPIVTTELPGTTPAVDGRSDRLVPPRNPEALAAAIIEALADTARPGPSIASESDDDTWDRVIAAIEETVRRD